MSKNIVVIAERHDQNGGSFRTVEVLEHQPITFTPGTPGWRGEGAGLSTEDLQKVFEVLAESAHNIHHLTIILG